MVSVVSTVFPSLDSTTRAYIRDKYANLSHSNNVAISRMAATDYDLFSGRIEVIEAVAFGWMEKFPKNFRIDLAEYKYYEYLKANYA